MGLFYFTYYIYYKSCIFTYIYYQKCIYLHGNGENWLNVGKYTSPMDPVGMTMTCNSHAGAISMLPILQQHGRVRRSSDACFHMFRQVR